MNYQLKGWVTPAIVGVASFAGGAIAGYFFKKYQDSRPSVQDLREEVADQITKTEDVSSGLAQLQFAFEERDRKYDVYLQQAMKVVAALQTEGKTFLNSQAVALKHDTAEVTFAVENDQQEWNEETDDDWDYEVEVPLRTPDAPYIIHRDEFFADEMGFDNTTTLTYYKGDDILVDQLDTPIYNPEKITGPLVFGHGSQDPSIVYIRNEKLQAEYEVLLEYGTFAAELLGQGVTKSREAEEFKHSLMKFSKDE